MAHVLVKGLDRETVGRLRARARRHGRSLQAELKQILDRAAGAGAEEVWALAVRIRKRLAGRDHSDSAELIAEDRRR